ncbi:FAD-binding domain-containing protein [Bacillus daqingensis]|uniref:FAD-binding domain-containing protein n=1 Tax=Bacillus daqingensis TaxID=872396 RepID=A0ABV9NTN9_9BACI
MQIVWLKRDLRVHDHRPLTEACRAGGPVLIVYVIEPDLWQNGDLSERHARFIEECLAEMQTEVRRLGGELYTACTGMVSLLEQLTADGTPLTLYAHEEHGTPDTFARDIEVRRWMKERGFAVYEYPSFGVTRGLQDRKQFDEKWQEKMQAPLLPAPNSIPAPPHSLPAALTRQTTFPKQLALPGEAIRYGQQGGESLGLETLADFLENRFFQYRSHLSNPISSSTSCSRLSPYLAWGALSFRRAYQESLRRLAQLPNPADRRQLEAFISRLHWHCHFIQRLEDEPELSERNMNRAFDAIRTDWDEEAYTRWKEGRTGIPFIDAAMRSLHKTGWINFRSRAMLVSFVSNTLLLDWRKPAQFLAQQFLDYEPGIHYSQMQMQSGTTGFNTIRIYNPIKQGREQDPDGRFIRRHVPELKEFSADFIHEPWKSPAFFHSQYCGAVVDVMEANRCAREVLWSVRDSEAGVKEAEQGLKKHASNTRRKEASAKKQKPAYEQLSLFDFDE